MKVCLLNFEILEDQVGEGARIWGLDSMAYVYKDRTFLP